MNKEKEYIYFRESALQSAISDIVEFGVLFAGFYVNYRFLGDKWYIAFLLIILFLIMVSARGNKKMKRFTSLKELKKYVDDLR